MKNAQSRTVDRRKGFSLTELLVALFILALVATLVAPQFFRFIGQANSQTATSQIESIATQLNFYRLENGDYPSGGEGLSVLVMDGGRGVPDDPWGQPYIYEYLGAGQARVGTYGADGEEGGEGEDADIFRNIQ
ncbi:type II secretion system major pseudopilin GspG [Hyphobacterium sp. HN65]|uniref:Type II secretion system core protein G n=1 Tax=Hyphobacterium lacteum TaxID=3116575 RepID=A0ABU7LNU5_9PROT|nr:type II secretion system major pseudopilin GspG [Hyphobacterium sp. HN65]MEE2525562.1 type II secretion system major pseudopilin GspG [Hyphobacterium sp. HN65]